MKSFTTSTEAPFAAAGSLASPPRDDADPYSVLDDLMAAVEAFCPTWPQRPITTRNPTLLL